MRYMARMLCCCLLGMSLSIVDAADRPDPIPNNVSPTAGTIYRLMYELERALPYPELARKVPNLGKRNLPHQVLEVLRSLELRGESRSMSYPGLIEQASPVLLQKKDRSWFLVENRPNGLHFMTGSEEARLITVQELSRIWTGEAILVRALSPDGKGCARMEFDETSHDGGEIIRGAMVSHSYRFKNVGDATLEVFRVQKSCGCTRAEIRGKKKIFAPDETGELLVELSTAGKRDGDTRTVVTIHSNECDQPTQRITISAKVLVPVVVTPPRSHLRFVPEGSVAKADFIVRSPMKADFEILEATASKPFLSVEVAERHAKTPGNTKERSYGVSVTVDSEGIELGDYSEKVFLKTNADKKPEVEIPIQFQIVAQVHAYPDVCTFSPLYPSRRIQRFVTIRNEGDELIEITGARSEIPDVSFEITVKDPGKLFQVLATFKPGENPQAFEGKAYILTTSSDYPEIPIKIRGVVPNKRRASGKEGVPKRHRQTHVAK